MVVAATFLQGGGGQAQDLSEDHREAISSIEKLGAKVTVKNADGEISTEVFLSDSLCENLGTAFALLPHLPSCRVVTAYWASVTDDEMEYLGELRDLEVLKLSDAFTGRSSEITDKGLRYLRHLTQLRTLSLANTRITNKGLVQFRNLRKLEEIDISKTIVGNDGVVHLSQLVSLKTLDLSNTRIDDAGLIHIGKLRLLETLYLSGTQVSGTKFDKLHRLERLVDCELNATPVTDLTCRKLTGLKQLKRLSLNDTRITDDACKQFVQLAHLETLALDWTFVTDEGAKKVRQALPQALIQIGTRLPDKDVAAITRLLKSKHDFKGEILGMNFYDSGDVEVTTGENVGFLSGQGLMFRLRKTNDRWKVVERWSWVS